MLRPHPRALPLLLAVPLAALTLTACAGSDSASDSGGATDGILVATTVSPITSIAAAVGGDLVILHSALGECLASALVDPDASPAGRVTASTLSVAPSQSASTSAATTTSLIYRTSRGPTVIIAQVAPERSVAWTSAVFAALQPASVFVVCGIPRYSFRGAVDAESTSDSLFCLHINKNVVCREGMASAPLLSNANLIDGLGAAVMLQAECEGLPASSVIAIELNRSPREAMVRCVGDILLSLLESRSMTPGEAAAIRKTCASKFAASADLSVYA